MIFLRADLSTAEHRVTSVLTHNAELISMARKRSHEFDAYKNFACMAFDKQPEQVTKLERECCKTVVLGTDYDMQAERMSDGLLKKGLLFSPDQCQVLQQKYLTRFPAIRDGYQYRCRMKCIQHRYLENSWGRRIYFTYERLGPDLNRRLYAWTPQSEIGDLLNQWGFIAAHQFIEKYNLKSKINLQVHDEVCLSSNVEEAWDLMRLLRDSLERERSYEGETLVIPVSFSLETRYHQEDIEFKQFPSHEEYLEGANKVWQNRIK